MVVKSRKVKSGGERERSEKGVVQGMTGTKGTGGRRLPVQTSAGKKMAAGKWKF